MSPYISGNETLQGSINLSRSTIWRPATNRALRIRVCHWLFAAILLEPGLLSAEIIPVHYPEGTTHGFLALRSLDGKLLASGDLTEVLHGNEVVSHLIFVLKMVRWTTTQLSILNMASSG